MLRTSPGRTASTPFREKGLNERVFSQSVPLSRPAPVQTGAKVRGFSPTGLEFTAETDSLLEGDGFEPSVPRRKRKVCSEHERSSAQQLARCRRQPNGLGFIVALPRECAPLRCPR